MMTLNRAKIIFSLLIVFILITFHFDLKESKFRNEVYSLIGEFSNGRRICEAPNISYADELLRKTWDTYTAFHECDRLNGTFVAIEDLVDKHGSVVYKFTLNMKDVTEKLQVIEDNVICTAEQFDRVFNVSERNKLSTLRRMNFTADANYTLIVDHHGYFEVACAKRDNLEKRIYDDQFLVMPHNMSKLIEERMAFKPFTKKAESVRFLDEENSLRIDKKMNVLMLRIDSLSYPNFKRSMPMLYNYLNSELENNVIFTNANSVGENTHPNLLPQFGGIVIENIESLNLTSEWSSYKKLDQEFYDPYPFIWYEYEKEGYLTGYQDDCPTIGVFYYVKHGFRYRPTSFYGRPSMVRTHKSKKSFNRCHHGRPLYKIIFDQVDAFLDRMHTVKENSNTPYFLFNFFGKYTHDFLRLSTKFDKHITDSLKAYDKKGYLDNTLLYIYSDHGLRLQAYSVTESGRVEKNWPFLSLRLPKRLWNTKYDKALRENKDKLISFFDQYQTLRHFLHLNANYSKEMDSKQFSENDAQVRHLRGISLFEDISKYRTCQNAMIPDNYCKCMETSWVSEAEFVYTKDMKFSEAANFLIASINNLTASESDMCAPFKVKKMYPVKKIYFSNRYQFSVVAEPGYASFDATLEIPSKQSMKVYGKILRTNLYGNQSHCINDAYLKNFCFCRDMLQTSHV